MRITSLDSLRGIAALTVVLSHMIITLPLSGVGLLLGQEFHVLAKDAVLIFFVLSGFVLFLSLNSNYSFNYKIYIIKRFTRIFLPFAAAILLSSGLMVILRPQPIDHLSLWFNNESWYLPITVPLLIYHLLMTDYQPWQSLDNVMWSLVHEIRISVIFPLLAFCIRIKWKTTIVFCFLISTLSLAAHSKWGYFGPVDLIATLRYLILFAAGAAMAFHRDNIRAWAEKQSGLVRLVSWVTTFALLTYPFKGLENVTTASGAVLLVLLCFADRKTDRHLSRPVPLWLGRVSYSLYLIHLPILLAMTHYFYDRIPIIPIIIFSLAISLIGSEVFFRVVETRSINYGRIFVNWCKSVSEANTKRTR